MLLNLRRYNDGPALLTEDRIITYSELADISQRIAVTVGSRVLAFVFCTNSPACVAGYVGFLRKRIVPVMLDAGLDVELAAELVERYMPEVLWLPESMSAFFQGQVLLRLGGYVLVRREEAAPFLLHDELALLMTTSGSTGSPKLVRQSYRNIEVNTRSIIEYLHIDSSERAVTNLPMHYVYGLSIINTHLEAGASLVVTGKGLFDKDFWQLMREQEVTSLAGVPYTYGMLARLQFFRMDLPALRTLTQAGGKLDPELHRKFAQYAGEHDKRFVVMYGAAEATARMGWLPPELSLSKVGYMGGAIPGGRFELIDESGKEVDEAGVIGELVYYGDNVAMGYAECGDDLAKGDEWQGRYETGDMAERDADGIYRIAGRKKRFLKIFGKRTNLEETEHILRQHFGIVDIACAGEDDLMRVYTTDERAGKEIKPYLAAKLGLHHSAFKVYVVSEIPKNAAGKTVYGDLCKLTTSG